LLYVSESLLVQEAHCRSCEALQSTVLPLPVSQLAVQLPHTDTPVTLVKVPVPHVAQSDAAVIPRPVENFPTPHWVQTSAEVAPCCSE
jgi:hypothetical protein